MNDKVLVFQLQTKGGKEMLTELTQAEKAAADYKKEVTRLRKELDELLKDSKGNKKAIDNTSEALEKATIKTKAAQESAKKLNTALRRNIKEYQQQEKAIPKDSLEGLRLSLVKLTDQYSKLSKAERGALSGKKLQRQISGQKKEIDKITASLGDFRSQVGNYAKGAKAFGRSLVSSLGIAGGVQLLATGLKDVARIIVDFDKEFTNLSVILNTNDKNLLALKESALQLGATTAFTAGQVVGLQTELAKLGFTSEQILNAAESVISFSVITRSEVPRAAAVAGAALRAFNKDSSEMEETLATLAVATTKSALDFRKLEVELPVVATTASALGVSLEKTVATLGVLADSGLDASTAATSFRNILIESAKRGVEYQVLIDKVANSTNKARTAFELFGKRGIAAALTLADTGEKAEYLEEAITGVGSELGNLADKQLQSIDGRLTLLKSAWEGLVLSFEDGGGVISESLKNVIDNFTDLLNAFTEFNTPTKEGTFKRERGELEALLKNIKEYNGEKEVQAVLLESLKSNYGDYVKDLDLEKLTLEDINKVLDTYTQKNEAKSIQADKEKELNSLLEAQKELITDIINEEAKVNSKSPLMNFLSGDNLTLLKGQLENVKTAISDIRGELETPVATGNGGGVWGGMSTDGEGGSAVSDLEKNLKDAEEIAKNETLGGIREQIAQLTSELDGLIIKSNDYNEKQEELRGLKEKLKDAQDDLNKKTNEYAVGTLGFLQQQLQNVKKAMLSTSEDGLMASVGDIKTAERELAQFNKALEDTTRLFEEQNFEELPLARRIEITKERIETEKAVAINAIEAKIQNEKVLQATLQYTEKLYENRQLSADLEGLTEGTREYEQVAAKMLKTTRELDTLDANIQIAIDQSAVDAFENRLIQLYTDNTEDEKLRADQILLIRMRAEQEYLRIALENTDLQGKARTDAELKVQENLRRIREQEAKVNVNYESSTSAISEGAANDIAAIVPEFNPDNIAASLFAIEEFERNKALITQNSQLEQLELEKKLLMEKEQSTATIEQQIAEKKLEIDRTTNERLIEQQRERIEMEMELQQMRADAIGDFAASLGDFIGSTLDDTYETAEERQKAFILFMLDSVEKVIQLQIASSAAQSFAQADSVATFGITGAARAAILAGLIKGAFSIAKAAVSSFNEDGGILYAQGGTTQPFKSGTVIRGKKHSQGGEKFNVKGRIHEAEAGEAIIKSSATSKWKGLLSAINVDGGGRNFGGADTGKWLSVLNTIPRFNDGGVTGSNSSANIPQLIPIDSTRGRQSRISIDEESLNNLTQALIEANAVIMGDSVGDIVGNVVEGLNTSDTIKKRNTRDRLNSEI